VTEYFVKKKGNVEEILRFDEKKKTNKNKERDKENK
jgi:hypothetical protein